MASRLELQSKLEELIGNDNVYFNPPASLKMQYPCIRYKGSGKDLKRAGNKIHARTNRYEGFVIDYDPDSNIPDKLLDTFEMCTVGSMYTADNLNHFPFTIYF
jgi:hypothetical protein